MDGGVGGPREISRSLFRRHFARGALSSPSRVQFVIYADTGILDTAWRFFLAISSNYSALRYSDIRLHNEAQASFCKQERTHRESPLTLGRRTRFIPAFVARRMPSAGIINKVQV